MSIEQARGDVRDIQPKPQVTEEADWVKYWMEFGELKKIEKPFKPVPVPPHNPHDHLIGVRIGEKLIAGSALQVPDQGLEQGDGPRTAFYHDGFVHPDHRKKGIMGLMYDAAEKKAKAAECDTLTGHIRLDNTPSLKSALRFGAVLKKLKTENTFVYEKTLEDTPTGGYSDTTEVRSTDTDQIKRLLQQGWDGTEIRDVREENKKFSYTLVLQK